jgi:hypothetical protein
MTNRNLAYGAAIAVLALAAAPAVYAQATTGGVAGRVTNESGQPVAGATVVIRHEPTGTTTTTVTNGDGGYAASNQRVGGPYTITVNAAGYSQENVQLPAVGLGDATSADVILFSANGKTVREVVVTATRTKDNMGPQTRVSLRDIEALPSINRDVRDVARASPYVLLDPNNSNAMIIGGQHNRTNSITIDGVKQTDDFGLQANGYPTQHSPISFSLVQALTVEVAPYDVQYGSFQGGTVNVVTKSGSNDFHGEAFYEKQNDKLRGNRYFTQDAITGADTRHDVVSKFSDRTYGMTLSGPIIKDKLFFVLNYEKEDAPQAIGFGPSDASVNNPIPGVTTAQADQVRSIVQNVYHYDPLSWNIANLPVSDKKYFAKLDWNINDQHRAVFEYQNTDGAALTSTGDSTSATAPSLSLLSKWYTLESKLAVTKGQIFSHWTDNFSTEIAMSKKVVDNISAPLGGSDFAQFRVYLPGTLFNPNGSPICGSPPASTTCPSIFLGPDVSRQANALHNTSTLLKFKGDYKWGNHTITGGVESEKLSIFNIFVQNATGTYVFNSLNDLQNRNAFSLQYNNASDNIKNDGAAAFTFRSNTAYLQDEWAVLPTLTIRGGVRYDWYTSGSRPMANPAFLAAYGYSNNKNLDGLSVLQPRLGFNWRPLPGLSVYGGAGLFSGGTPNVWISNQYTNTGNLLGNVFLSCGTNAPGSAGCDSSLKGVDGFNVGTSAKNANTASTVAGSGNANALTPGFEPASLWKESIGVRYDTDLDQWHLGQNWHFGAEYLNSKVKNALYWNDIYQQKFICSPSSPVAACNGFTAAPDGRPIFGNALPVGQTLYGTASRLNRSDVVFQDTDKGYARQISFWFGKEWKEGLWRGLSMNYSFTHMQDQDVGSATSSVATSSYRQTAISDPNGAVLANSNYLIKTAQKVIIEYDHKWFGDNTTKIGFFIQQRTGLPFSYTFQDQATGSGASTGMFGENSLYTTTNRQLLYIPQGNSAGVVTFTSDPHVQYAAAFTQAQLDLFNAFLQTTGLSKYEGKITPRNAFFSRPVGTIDVHLAQEFPAAFLGLPSTGKSELYMDIQNLGNMIDPHWGVISQTGFPYFLSPIVARNCQFTAAACSGGVQNKFQFDSFTRKFQASSFDNVSTWQIKVGVRYRF